MKYLFMFLIRLYWLSPKKWRRRCVFKENCSAYIYRMFKEKGVKAGIDACRQRYSQCRPGYTHFKTDDGTQWVMLKDETIIKRDKTTL
jgi:putative component of membrane protein insertase Oxa1/YidC/SpoIIIJ protein YidD